MHGRCYCWYFTYFIILAFPFTSPSGFLASCHTYKEHEWILHVFMQSLPLLGLFQLYLRTWLSDKLTVFILCYMIFSFYAIISVHTCTTSCGSVLACIINCVSACDVDAILCYRLPLTFHWRRRHKEVKSWEKFSSRSLVSVSLSGITLLCLVLCSHRLVTAILSFLGKTKMECIYWYCFKRAKL